MLDERIFDKYGLEIDGSVIKIGNDFYHAGMPYINESIICAMEGIPWSAKWGHNVCSEFRVFNHSVDYVPDDRWIIHTDNQYLTTQDLKRLWFEILGCKTTRCNKTYRALCKLDIKMYKDFFGSIEFAGKRLPVDTREFNEHEFYETILSQVTDDFHNPQLINFIKELKK